MRCPFCGDKETQVKDSRPTEDSVAVRRRRFCQACGGRFTTFERIQLRELIVVKRDGSREEFDRDKVARSINISLRKRNVPAEKVDQMINGIVRRLESSGETEVTSNTIGQTVMEALANVDTVAYVRFASVYHDFQETNDFETFISNIRPDKVVQSGS
jgi:transcriptional repressor NrdR